MDATRGWRIFREPLKITDSGARNPKSNLQQLHARTQARKHASTQAHTVCTNAHHTPLKRLTHRETFQSHWFMGPACACGLMEAVDTVDRCGGKDGFQSACQAGAGSTSTTAGLTRALALSQGRIHSPHPYTHTRTHTASGQGDWAESFHHRQSVLYGRSVMHHPAYFNISLPLFSSTQICARARTQFLTVVRPNASLYETLNGCN